jgi:beta-glucanase (GH16 family)
MRYYLLGLFLMLASPLPLLAQSCPLQLDSARWEEVMRDDFSGPALDTTLWDRTPRKERLYGWGTEWYDAHDTSLVTVRNGIARLKATRWRYPDGRTRDSLSNEDPSRPNRLVQYRSGMLNLNGDRLDEAYGVYEARLRLPANVGAWPTFWLWSCSTEIDIMDGVDYSGPNIGAASNVIDNRLKADGIPVDDYNCVPLEASPAPSVKHSLEYHAVSVPVKANQKGESLSRLTTEFNTFSVVWTPDEVQFFINGWHTVTVPKSVVATVQDYVMLMINMQMAPWAQGEDVFLDVDYVRILKPRRPAGSSTEPRPYATTSFTPLNCGPRPRRWYTGLLNLFK